MASQNHLLQKLYRAFIPMTLRRSIYSARIVTKGWLTGLPSDEIRYPTPHPDWREVLERERTTWQQARAAARGGPKVLIATSVGGYSVVTAMESMLAVALTLRGAEVHFVLCDQQLPACQIGQFRSFTDIREYADHGPQQSLCARCYLPARHTYQTLGLPIHYYSELISPTERDNARILAEQNNMTIEALGSYRFEGMNVGEHALAGTLRFYARGTLGDDSYQTEIARRYFEASLLTSYAMRRLLSNYSFNASCCNHGIYVPHGLVGEAARSAGVRVVNWNAGYRKQRFIFSHGDTYHHTMLSEPTRNWDTMPWTSETETATIEYLKSRWQGTNDWIWFHDRPDEALDSIATQTGVDFEKPCIGLLTNVIWDAQLHYRANAFPNMLVWLIETIKYFARRPNLQLLIRVHPAEIRGFIPSRQHAVDEIRKVFPTLPPNVFVVPPESQVSTYAAMERCDAVIIYGTKTGVELTSLGIPVIVAGEAWIRDKGITMDARSTEEYFAWLDRLPLQKRLPKEVVTRAHKYAYHFFFRRMIPLPFMRVLQGWPPYELALESLSQLQPGKSKGLDVICDGILQGKEFIYPEETLTGHSVPDSLSTRV